MLFLYTTNVTCFSTQVEILQLDMQPTPQMNQVNTNKLPCFGKPERGKEYLERKKNTNNHSIVKTVSVKRSMLETIQEKKERRL